MAVGSQIAAIVVWLVVSLHFLPSVIRIMKKEGNPWDRAGAFAMITGLVFNFYLLRWIVLGQVVVESMPLLKWWSVANFSTIMLGLGSLFGFETAEVKRGNVQTRGAVILWGAMTIGCVLLAYFI
jgi:hypothetical protein